MNKINKVERFLKLILEIKKNGIEIDANLVYSNLININSKKESVRNYFTSFIDKFGKDKNIGIISDNYFTGFKSKNYKSSKDKIKIYIPLDISHFYRGINEIFDYVSKSNILFSLKISSDVRFDDVVLQVESKEDAESIKKFIQENSYVKEGLLNTNPFAINDGNISFTCDRSLSYNYVISHWISDYINEHDEVSFSSFYDFIYDRYLEVFKNGNGINEFAKNKNFIDYVNDLVNYQIATEILILALKNASVNEFYEYYENIVEKRKLMSTRIKDFLKNDIAIPKFLPEEKEIFDYSIVEICKSSDILYAFQCLKFFEENGNYRVFTRKNNFRKLLIKNLSREGAHHFILEEQKLALNNASVLTMKKYDAIQLARALFRLREGDYTGFTNEENARDNLKMLISSNDLIHVINNILMESGYFEIKDEEVIWLYVELIERLKQKEI